MPVAPCLTERRTSPRRGAALRWLSGVCLLAWAGQLAAQTAGITAGTSLSSPEIAAWIESRLAQDPDDAAALRLLGRTKLESGDPEAARSLLERSLAAEPDSAATHFDLGQTHIALGESQSAANHLARVVAIAPDSDYARRAERELEQLPPPESAGIVPAGYEVRTFDGSETTESVLDDAIDAAVPDPLRIRIETGAIYNSNVTLAPTNRTFVNGEAGSPQGVFNSALEYRAINTPEWRAGPLFQSALGINNSDFDAFNLRSLQGGVFAERSVPIEGSILAPRMQYAFTLDQFGGETFGRRHAVTTSLTQLHEAGDALSLYWTVDATDIADDGALPPLTSQDGWTNTLGVARAWTLDQPWMKSVVCGVDGQWAALDGSNVAYRAVSLYGASTTQLSDNLFLVLEAGWGYRNLYDAAVAPDPDIMILRGAARLELALTEHWTLALVLSGDRFDSDEPANRAERVQSGLLAVFAY